MEKMIILRLGEIKIELTLEEANTLRGQLHHQTRLLASGFQSDGAIHIPNDRVTYDSDEN